MLIGFIFFRVVETCRTEEFAYISSFEVDNRSPRSFSQSSSFDRITVIDKQDDFNKICKEFEKRMLKTKNLGRGACVKPQNKNQNIKAIANNRNTIKTNTKSITQKANNSKVLALEYNAKKQCNNSCGDTKQNKIQRNRESPPFDKTKTDFEYSLPNKINDTQFSNDIDGEEIVEQEFIYSGNSGSSKAAADNELINKKGN